MITSLGQLCGHDSREGNGPPWQTGVGLAGRVGESYKHGLHRDVRTPVNVMASQCSVCSTLDHTSECVKPYTLRVKAMEERLPRRPESTGEGRSSDAETRAASDDGAGRETTRRRAMEECDASDASDASDAG